MAELAVIGALVGLVGSGVSAVGEMQAGDAALEDALFEADQLEDKGKEEFAASQREAFTSQREATLAKSKGQAMAAASGAGAGVDAPDVANIMGNIASQGALNADAALFGGESRRFGLRKSAQATRRTGRARQQGSRTSALGTVLGGFGRAASTIGGLPQFSNVGGF